MPKQKVSDLKAFFGRYLDKAQAEHNLLTKEEAIAWLEEYRVEKNLTVSKVFRDGINATATHRTPNQ